LDALATSDVALIDEELAEHQRWGAALEQVGAAGSATRANFVAQQADAGTLGGGSQALVTGLGMGAATRALEIAGERGALRLAGQAGQALGRTAPIPAIGAVIGGVMSAMDLAERDWGQTGQTIGRLGEGASDYDLLANSIAAVSEIISVYTSVLNVIAGVVGAISIAMWIITVVTLGVASPLAATLSTIAAAIGIATMILDGINAMALQPLITTFRALHAFKSQADPTEVEEQGAQVRQAAAAGAGFVGGFAGGLAGSHGASAAGRRAGLVPPHTAPTPHETPPPAAGEGTTIHADPPPHAPIEGEGMAPRQPGEPILPPAEPHAPMPEIPAPPRLPDIEAPPPGTPLEPGTHPVNPEGPTMPAPADPNVDPYRPTEPVPPSADGAPRGMRRITDKPAGVAQVSPATQMMLPGIDLASSPTASPAGSPPSPPIGIGAGASPPISGGRLVAITPPLHLAAFGDGQAVPTGVQPGAIGTYGRAVANPHPAALLSNPPNAPGATRTGGRMPRGVRKKARVFAEHQTPAAVAGEVIPNYEYQKPGGRSRSGQDVREALTISLPEKVKPLKDAMDNALLAEVRQRQDQGRPVPPIEVIVRGAQHVQEAVAQSGASVPPEQVSRMFLAEVDQFNGPRYGNQEIPLGQPLPQDHPLTGLSVSEIEAHVDHMFEPFVAPVGTQFVLPGLEAHMGPPRAPGPEPLALRLPDTADKRQLALPFDTLRRMADPGASTGGGRGTAPLTAEQRTTLLEMASQMGYPPNQVHFHSGDTGVAYGHLFIGPDVNPHPQGIAAGGVNPANSAIGPRGALGHEIIGHIESEIAGQTRLEDWHEEFQASTRAALLTPDLPRDQMHLLTQDAAGRRRGQREPGETIYVWTEPLRPAAGQDRGPQATRSADYSRPQDQMPSVMIDWGALGMTPPVPSSRKLPPARGAAPSPASRSGGGRRGFTEVSSAPGPLLAPRPMAPRFGRPLSSGEPGTLDRLRHGYVGTLAGGLWSAVPGVEQVHRGGRLTSTWFGDERLRPSPSRRDAMGQPIGYSRNEQHAIAAGGLIGASSSPLGGGVIGQRVGEGVIRRGLDLREGLIRGATEPIVERVNPAYPPPPEGGYGAINALQERLSGILEARASAEASAAAARHDAAHHQANMPSLYQFEAQTSRSISATQAHQAATQRRQQANARRQASETDVSRSLADAAQRRSGLSTLTVPLRGFQRFSSLGESMPDGIDLYPTALVGPKAKIRQLNRDATDFLNALDGVDATIGQQRDATGSRQQEVTQHNARLTATGTGATTSMTSLERTRQQGEQLAQRNQQRADESARLAQSAASEGTQLDGEAQQTRTAMQSSAQRWQAWATAHRAARQAAIERRRRALEERGYRVRQVTGAQ